MLENIERGDIMSGEEKGCPLCGEENHCGVAKGKEHCWCMTVNFPQQLLTKVEGERQKCICQKCLANYKK